MPRKLPSRNRETCLRGELLIYGRGDIWVNVRVLMGRHLMAQRCLIVTMTCLFLVSGCGSPCKIAGRWTFDLQSLPKQLQGLTESGIKVDPGVQIKITEDGNADFLGMQCKESADSKYIHLVTSSSDPLAILMCKNGRGEIRQGRAVFTLQRIHCGELQLVTVFGAPGATFTKMRD